MSRYFARTSPHSRRGSAVIFLVLVLCIGFLATRNYKAAHAASLSLRIPNEVYAHNAISFSWTSDANATTFNLIAALRPNMSNAFILAQHLSGTTASYNQTLDTSVGYRYFQLQAYDASGNRLATSNVVGIAKYGTGVVIRMTTDSSLTNQYAAYSDTCYNVPTWFIPNDSTDGSSYVAPNFQLSEFFSSETYPNGVVDPVMVQHVQNIRNDWGSSLTLTSGFRTPAHNATLSGSATCSSHTFGQAVDIAVSSYSTWQTLIGYAQQENASYTEPWQPDVPHMHADWRNFYQNPPYTNW